MKLAKSSLVPEIDRYCATSLGISVRHLMDRSGEAVARVVRERVTPGGEVLIFAGSGNNGGDGYAAACKLHGDYCVTVFDVFSAGQRTEEGKYYLSAFRDAGGTVENFAMSDALALRIAHAACIIDAIFGTGFHGEVPAELIPLAEAIQKAVNVRKIAIDVPLGVNADDGSVAPFALYVGATVELAMIKTGLVSYPARAYVGELVFDDLGLPLEDKIYPQFDIRDHLIEKVFVKLHLPEREKNSNKGSFGKLLVITGSERYHGAAALSLEGALRGGAGYVTYLGTEDLVRELSAKFPEALYQKMPAPDAMTEADMDAVSALSEKNSATLIGCGSGNTPALARLVVRLLGTGDTPLILDADAINALAAMGEEGLDALRTATRPVILTPHPLEFSRLAGQNVNDVQQHRIERARAFVEEYGCTLVLKGAGTVVIDSEELFINHTGSSALAKAGSGDVLAGTLSSLIAMGTRPIIACALAVYFHGLAADHLAVKFSSFGVIPSDLPTQIGQEIARIENDNSKAAHTLDRSLED